MITSTKTSATKFGFKFDYCSPLFYILFYLIQNDLTSAFKFMHYYQIKPIHFKENLNDLQFPKHDYYGIIDTNVKAQFTRKYNKLY